MSFTYLQISYGNNFIVTGVGLAGLESRANLYVLVDVSVEERTETRVKKFAIEQAHEIDVLERGLLEAVGVGECKKHPVDLKTPSG